MKYYIKVIFPFLHVFNFFGQLYVCLHAFMLLYVCVNVNVCIYSCSLVNFTYIHTCMCINALMFLNLDFEKGPVNNFKETTSTKYVISNILKACKIV